jgi:hypothetical protein
VPETWHASPPTGVNFFDGDLGQTGKGWRFALTGDGFRGEFTVTGEGAFARAHRLRALLVSAPKMHAALDIAADPREAYAWAWEARNAVAEAEGVHE